MAFTASKGTFDVIPGLDRDFGSEQWRRVVDLLTQPARLAAYGYIETPIFEDTALFHRGVGESTDVVSKEMFTFTDRGERSLTLRPEMTASVVRAVNEHSLHRGQLPVKLWYAGAMFRAERPQAGRYRQFTQVGIEALGVDDAALDAEVIALGVRAFAAVGLPHVQLLLNSMGDANCRPAYTELLRSYLRDNLPSPNAETLRRLELNPLRILDDKRADMADVIAGAPILADSLCDECRAYDAAVRGHLDDLEIAYVDAPRLVRGLDYYRRTTFEFQHGLLGAQNAVGGGGRYDGLSESIGGDPLPGIGWAFGVERILLALKAEAVAIDVAPRCEVYVVPLGAAAKKAAVRYVDALRGLGIAADMAYGDRGLKGAMKGADRSGARLALILGDRDLAAGEAPLKNLTTGEQSPVSLDDAAAHIAAALHDLS
ncbi:MAG: histidyl-tRNA synthetase [Frankiaceae bacterium]|nr:histidyl-tRNA synthetase [Frankiaceae bacterium]